MGMLRRGMTRPRLCSRGWGHPERGGRQPQGNPSLLLLGLDSRALILGLRRNHGGQSEGVSNFLSHCFADGMHGTSPTSPIAPAPAPASYGRAPCPAPASSRRSQCSNRARPLSGGEECVYDLNQQRRATILGEVTGGGANPGSPAVLGHGFAAFILSDRDIKPIT